MKTFQFAILALFALIFSGCKNSVSDEELSEVSHSYSTPVKVYISGLPKVRKITLDNLEKEKKEDEGGLDFYGEIGISVGSGDYPHYPYRYDDYWRWNQRMRNFGAIPDIYNSFNSELSTWAKCDAKLLAEYVEPKGDEIVILVDIRDSFVEVDKSRDNHTVSASILHVDENYHAKLGIGWGKYFIWSAVIDAQLTYLYPDGRREVRDVFLTDSFRGGENRDPSRRVFLRVSRLLGREITYELLKMK